MLGSTPPTIAMDTSNILIRSYTTLDLLSPLFAHKAIDLLSEKPRILPNNRHTTPTNKVSPTAIESPASVTNNKQSIRSQHRSQCANLS